MKHSTSSPPARSILSSSPRINSLTVSNNYFLTQLTKLYYDCISALSPQSLLI